VRFSSQTATIYKRLEPFALAPDVLAQADASQLLTADEVARLRSVIEGVAAAERNHRRVLPSTPGTNPHWRAPQQGPVPVLEAA
jgi:hypothetical protein